MKNQQCDGRTDIVAYFVACTRLKNKHHQKQWKKNNNNNNNNNDNVGCHLQKYATITWYPSVSAKIFVLPSADTYTEEIRQRQVANAIKVRDTGTPSAEHQVNGGLNMKSNAICWMSCYLSRITIGARGAAAPGLAPRGALRPWVYLCKKLMERKKWETSSFKQRCVWSLGLRLICQVTFCSDFCD